jgi:hypothetical protein
VLEQLQTRLTAWVGSGDIETLLQSSEVARNHEFWVRRAAFLSEHQMSESEEISQRRFRRWDTAAGLSCTARFPRF